MIRHGLHRFALATAAATLFSLPAFAAGPDGVWTRVDGMAKVQFAPCGGGYCGTIVWLKHPEGPGAVGQQVFFGMAQAGPNKWTGQAFNPEDGKTYDGSMTLSGNRLSTQGCALGGMICKTSNWRKG